MSGFWHSTSIPRAAAASTQAAWVGPRRGDVERRRARPGRASPRRRVKTAAMPNSAARRAGAPDVGIIDGDHLGRPVPPRQAIRWCQLIMPAPARATLTGAGRAVARHRAILAKPNSAAGLRQQHRSRSAGSGSQRSSRRLRSRRSPVPRAMSRNGQSEPQTQPSDAEGRRAAPRRTDRAGRPRRAVRTMRNGADSLTAARPSRPSASTAWKPGCADAGGDIVDAEMVDQHAARRSRRRRLATAAPLAVVGEDLGEPAERLQPGEQPPAASPAPAAPGS